MGDVRIFSTTDPKQTQWAAEQGPRAWGGAGVLPFSEGGSRKQQLQPVLNLQWKVAHVHSTWTVS